MTLPRWLPWSVAIVPLVLGGCRQKPGGGDKTNDVEIVETLTETVANRLIEFSYALKKRRYEEAKKFLDPEFQGNGYRADAEWTDRVEELALAVTRRHRKVDAKAATLDAEGFVADLEALLAPFESINRVFVKTRGAEFAPGHQQGTLKLTTEFIGTSAGGSMRAVYGYAKGQVRLRDGVWSLSRFELDRYQITTRQRPIFSDVAEAAGVAHTGVRLGKDGNEKFYWRGAACADVDGDGRYDVFSSAHDRNFLYINLGNGRFEDRAKQFGLSEPIGPTSPLFFDFDRDGDKDLFMGFVGWEDDGVPGGDPLHVFRNDGGKFTDVTKEVGLGEVRCCAFTTIATDVDNDGWLDLYVCAYNRLDTVYPDSWYDATNGNRNLLFLNRGGEKFEEVATERGVAGHGWSYAAAAADFDEDGDQDLYVANDYGRNNLYLNDGTGKFTDVAEKMGVLDIGNGMGAAWGDLNNDGKLDLYVSNMSSSAGNRILKRLARQGSGGVTDTLFKLAAGNTIFERDGDTFKMLSPEAGGIGASWAWGVSLFDIDLDGRLDIYVANGFISGDSLKDT